MIRLIGISKTANEKIYAFWSVQKNKQYELESKEPAVVNIKLKKTLGTPYLPMETNFRLFVIGCLHEEGLLLNKDFKIEVING